jgi:hypothetical protein
MANLIYKGNKANLPAKRNATSFYLCEDTRELYFGANLYTEAVRFYTTDKPVAPAQGVLYIDTVTGAGDVWNGTSWSNVIKGYATTIAEGANDTTVPTTKATKDYIDQKVSDVVAGSIDGLGALASKDEVAETDLAAALAQKLNGKADQTALEAEIARATAAEGQNATDIDALEGRMDTAEGKITTLVGADTGKSVRAIANEELAAQLIPEDAQDSLDTLAEIAAWIQSHPDDASAMNAAIAALQAILDGIGDTESGEKATVVAYVTDAIAALNIGDYAKASALTALAGRVTALEGATHTHANKALLDTYAQTETDLADAVAKKHEHTNKTVLDGITSEKVAKWDAAEQNAKDYADGLADDYDAAGAANQALADAKAYTDEKDTAMGVRMTAVEEIVTVGTF